MSPEPIFALWPIIPFGADDENESGNSQTDNSGQSSQQSSDQGGQGNSGQNQENNSDSDEDDPYKGLSAKELKKLLKDAEENGTTAAQELETLRREKQEAENAKLSEDQRKDKRINDLEAENSTLRTSLAKQSIINAINADKRYEWNSAEIVAQQLDSEKVKVDDKGKVTGLEKELARIASNENLKFLLRNKDSEQKQEQQNNGGVVTGFQPGQGGATSGNGIPENAQELAKLMPALNSRVG